MLQQGTSQEIFSARRALSAVVDDAVDVAVDVAVDESRAMDVTNDLARSLASKSARKSARRTTRQKLRDVTQSIRHALLAIDQARPLGQRDPGEAPTTLMSFEAIHARMCMGVGIELGEAARSDGDDQVNEELVFDVNGDVNGDACIDTNVDTETASAAHVGSVVGSVVASVVGESSASRVLRLHAALLAHSSGVSHASSHASLHAASGAHTEHVMVPLGDPECDKFLGGGLVCGALHEIRGVFTQRNSRSGVHETQDHAEDAKNAENIEENEQNWIVPFGSITHIVQRAAACEELRHRAIAWIGDRVQPEPSALVMSHIASDAASVVDRMSVLARSVYVRDMSLSALSSVDESRSVGAQHSTRTSKQTGKRTGKRTSKHRVIAAATNPVQMRAWCAEQALRTAAASIIVLDGSGFDFLMWRRLQLAASSCELPVLVLVICPPPCSSAHASVHESVHASSNGLQPQRHPGAQRHDQHNARPAATQWYVSSGYVSSGSVSSGGLAQSSLAFRWSMTLQAIRGKAVNAMERGRQACRDEACTDASETTATSSMHHGGVSAWMSAVADERIGIHIEMPRSTVATAEWTRLAHTVRRMREDMREDMLNSESLSRHSSVAAVSERAA